METGDEARLTEEGVEKEEEKVDEEEEEKVEWVGVAEREGVEGEGAIEEEGEEGEEERAAVREAIWAVKSLFCWANCCSDRSKFSMVSSWFLGSKHFEI